LQLLLLAIVVAFQALLGQLGFYAATIAYIALFGYNSAETFAAMFDDMIKDQGNQQEHSISCWYKCHVPVCLYPQASSSKYFMRGLNTVCYGTNPSIWVTGSIF
jgi:hypothetical protein